MKDKEIRKILIAYLQATSQEMRIYQEKSIGSSICDVMAVTDQLIGYEIKSDSDNLMRLDNQIKAYNLFFDKNYIVVSERFAFSARDVVPETWGIIQIQNDSVVIEREAKNNKEVSRYNQLSILWKIELKNLLIKNQLPLCAQKDKGYIKNYLFKNVGALELGKQIAEELLNRDYSIYDAEDYTIHSKNEEEILPKEWVDVLSEEDLSVFTLDKWIELYKHAISIKQKKEREFGKRKIDRPSHNILYTDIEVSLGVPWISEHIVRDFVFHLLDEKPYGACVTHEKVTGAWFIHDKKWLGDRNANASVKYGIPRYNALFIIEAMLNLREIKIFDGTKYNERDTIAALEKEELIAEEFKRWVWLDEDRRWEIEEQYNNLFGKYKIQTYDGSKLCFPDMNPQFTLYPYQKDAIKKIICSPNTLLAFDVGAGKTYIMIAAAMKMRQEGISRKNMFVVPNHIVGQWEKIFTDLYPKAKVLAIEPKVFKPELRQKVLEQIKTGDYDGIIIAYSCFEMIPLSRMTILDNMESKLQIIENAIAAMRYVQDGVTYIKGWGDAPLNREKKYLHKLTDEFLKCMTPSTNQDISFEDLEINTIFLDEAHNYKNLPIRTNLKNLNGINIKGSNKCLDMLHKIRCVQNNNNGRGAVFATGTPLCNSISDAYSLQIYLQYEELQKCQLDVFDNWVKTFAKPEQLCEIDVDTSSYRMIRRFARFHNLPELSQMFSQVAIYYAMEGRDNLPNINGYEDVLIPLSEELQKYMHNLCKRTDEIRSGRINPKHDNMLKVSTDGRKAALDLKLVKEQQPEAGYSKVDNCVGKVTEIYYKYPCSTQVIFCDYSTPKGENYSVYKELQSKLCSAGIAEKEIAFIHSYQTESRKLELYRKFNAGEMRIIIGSTFKLGTGANVQVKLKAIHHLDVPWRPADMVQREGRMIRQGNENKEVYIYRYITEGSFDSYSWQILETKQRFISQFLKGTSYQRTSADLDNNVLNYAEVKALALSEPIMKELAEKENKAKSLRLIIAKEEETRTNLSVEAEELEPKICKLKKRYEVTIENANYLSHFTDEIYMQEYNKISEIISEDIIHKKKVLENEIYVLGFQVIFPDEQDEKKPYIFIERGEERYKLNVSTSTKGNARRIINVLKGFEKKADEELKRYQDAVHRKQEIREMLEVKDKSYKEELKYYEAEIERLKDMLKIET